MIWLTGAHGMLGQEVEKKLKTAGDEYRATDVDVDITDPQQIENFASEIEPDFIINCAAYTAVDRAEDEEEKAEAINTHGPMHLAHLAESREATLIHVSTDYVFNGMSGVTYCEEDPVNPLGVYGRSKARGETAVQKYCSRYFIVRTSWLYGIGGSNFVTTMLRLFNIRKEIGVVKDQRGTPTYAPDLAAVLMLIAHDKKKRYGIYHYTDEGETNWYEFALEIQRQAKELGLTDGRCRINPLTTEQYPTKAKRPACSLLNKTKIKEIFGLAIPQWQDSLNHYLKELNNNA